MPKIGDMAIFKPKPFDSRFVPIEPGTEVRVLALYGEMQSIGRKAEWVKVHVPPRGFPHLVSVGSLEVIPDG